MKQAGRWRRDQDAGKFCSILNTFALILLSTIIAVEPTNSPFANETSPSDDVNLCATELMAGMILDNLNKDPTPKQRELGLSIVDIEDIKTLSKFGQPMTCHLTAVWSNDFHQKGVFSLHLGAVGQTIYRWIPDK